MTIAELIKLYRMCETDAGKRSDSPVDLAYFMGWLESNGY